MFKRTLVLSIAALLTCGCETLMRSSTKRTPPPECIQPVEPLKALPTGTQAEEELWIADAAPKYKELKDNYECLKEWSDSDDDAAAG